MNTVTNLISNSSAIGQQSDNIWIQKKTQNAYRTTIGQQSDNIWNSEKDPERTQFVWSENNRRTNKFKLKSLFVTQTSLICQIKSNLNPAFFPLLGARCSPMFWIVSVYFETINSLCVLLPLTTQNTRFRTFHISQLLANAQQGKFVDNHSQRNQLFPIVLRILRYANQSHLSISLRSVYFPSCSKPHYSLLFRPKWTEPTSCVWAQTAWGLRSGRIRTDGQFASVA